MKTFLTTLLIVVSLIGFTNAQGNMAVGAGVLVSLPMGDFGDGANTGFGGSAAFELEFMPQLVGVGNAGYISWGTEAEGFSFTAIPVVVGVKYFFVPAVGFYGLGQIGLTFMSFDTPSFNIPGFGSVGGGSVSSSEFTLVIGAGYELPVSPTVDLDFTGGLNVVSDANHITLRAGAKFAL